MGNGTIDALAATLGAMYGGAKGATVIGTGAYGIGAYAAWKGIEYVAKKTGGHGSGHDTGHGGH